MALTVLYLALTVLHLVLTVLLLALTVLYVPHSRDVTLVVTKAGLPSRVSITLLKSGLDCLMPGRDFLMSGVDCLTFGRDCLISCLDCLKFATFARHDLGGDEGGLAVAGLHHAVELAPHHQRLALTEIWP